MSHSPQNPAVVIRGACKTYGNSPVLHQLDMTVPTGVTYALLGSSGSGKTTLLSTLVGLSSLSSGSVHLFSDDVSQKDATLVGYMPQESGLHTELRISEELSYFGRLAGLERKVVKERIRFLVKLLQLPESDPIIQNLSGGEGRRVSLAVALLHKPRLLVLDEPTVGIDPLLRQSIWQHLSTLVKEEGTTILLSTHYTEEARSADVVAVLRHGRLLVEENPGSLMTRWGTELLENVVVQLARGQELEGDGSHLTSQEPTVSHRIRGVCQKEKNIVNISYTRKNSKELITTGMEMELKRRHSGEPLEDVVIQNDKSRQSSQQLTRRRSGDKLKRMPSLSGQDGSTISQYSYKTKSQSPWQRVTRHLQILEALSLLNFTTYLRHPIILLIILTMPANNLSTVYYIYSPPLNTDLGVVNLEQPNCFHLPSNQVQLGSQEQFPSEATALAALHSGRNHGYVLLPANFSRNLLDRAAFGRFADDEILDGSSLKVHLDYSNSIRTGFLYKRLTSGLSDFFASTYVAMINEGTTRVPSHETSWAEMAAVGQLVYLMVMMPMVVGVTMIRDQKRGSFSRTRVSGGSLPHLFLALLPTYFAIATLQTGLNWVTILALNIPCKGSALDFFLINYAQSWVGLSFGFLLGLGCREEIEAIFAILALVIASSAAQEISSLENVEQEWMRWIIMCLPTKVATVSLENIMFRGWNFAYPAVWRCLLVQGGWIGGCLGLSAILFGRCR